MSFTPVTKYDLTNDELDFLRDLTKQGTKFLLVGMLAAIFQGADGLCPEIRIMTANTGQRAELPGSACGMAKIPDGEIVARHDRQNPGSSPAPTATTGRESSQVWERIGFAHHPMGIGW
jgi:hypothetical protein